MTSSFDIRNCFASLSPLGQRLESVSEHSRTIAEERITPLMQRSLKEDEKLERN